MIELRAPRHILSSSIYLSGSKSISNRFLILKEISGLALSFENLSTAEDTELLQKALKQIENKKTASINVHHAGTDMRFLTAFLAVQEGEWTLTGSERMKQRPIGELVTALKSLGAEITYLEKENFPPLSIHGKKLSGGKIEIDSSVSSQFISALLLIAPKFENGLELHLKGETVSAPYIQMTIALLKQAGISIEQKKDQIRVGPSSVFHFPSSIHIESDWSSASYWYSICALAGNAQIELHSLDQKSLQADSVLPQLFENLGVKTTFKEHSIILSSIKPVSTEFNYDFTNCPDIAQTLAVTCFGLGIKAKFTGLSTLKVKETDRLFALKTELAKFGASVDISNSTLELGIAPPKNLSQEPIRINTYNDHRMAMSFAALALRTSAVLIDDPAVVAKSYPAFWEDLKSVGFNVNLHA